MGRLSLWFEHAKHLPNILSLRDQFVAAFGVGHPQHVGSGDRVISLCCGVSGVQRLARHNPGGVSSALTRL
jgi:hypothetical protein